MCSLDTMITVGALCKTCNTYYKQKLRTVLCCFKVHNSGDVDRFIDSNYGRIVDGRIVMDNFRTKCKHDGAAVAAGVVVGGVVVVPPYGVTSTGKSVQEVWLDYAIAQYEAGNITSCLLLLTTAHAYDWFTKVMPLPHAYLKHKLKFWTPEGVESALSSPQFVVYLGTKETDFCRIFREIAFIPGLNSWAMKKE